MPVPGSYQYCLIFCELKHQGCIKAPDTNHTQMPVDLVAGTFTGTGCGVRIRKEVRIPTASISVTIVTKHCSRPQRENRDKIAFEKRKLPQQEKVLHNSISHPGMLKPLDEPAVVGNKVCQDALPPPPPTQWFSRAPHLPLSLAGWPLS